MTRRTTALAVLLCAVGCGGGGPEPALVFPDTHRPGEEVGAWDDTTGDIATPNDLLVDGGDVPADTVENPDLGEDAPTPDAGEDAGSPQECEEDHDCVHLSDDTCTFWFCHPSKKTCKPATFGDGSPCDDGDPCTEGDQCHEGFCVGGPNVCTGPECGDGYCQDLETCETCPQDCGSCESSCCQGGSLPGCDDPLCQEIVCAIDDFCCTQKWDWACAEYAEDHCSVCGGGATCGDGFCDFGEDCQTCPLDCDGSCDSDCCFVHPGGGCDHENCEYKICQQDPACCDNSWDAFCVEDALTSCGICD